MTGLCPLLNAHGDTVGLTQGTEALKTNCVYSAFGEYSDLQGTPFRYNGQYYDTESGLYYLRNRYYDPTIGRFTQEDPVKSGLNWYAYCNNNPVKFCDPWGLFDYNTILNYNPNQRNDDVIALQSKLADLGYLTKSDVDGYFGQRTLDAVNAYKTSVGIWNFGEYYGKVGLTTWQSLGMIYRTQGDIERGVTIFTEAEGRQLYDVTKMFNDQLWYAEQFLNEKWQIDKQLTFYEKVNHNGDWDIKVEDIWYKLFGGAYPGSPTSEVILYGEYSTPEIMGNMMYAYLGRCIGFSETVLYWGGDYAQDGFSGIRNSSDSPEDKESIKKGFDLFNRKKG